MHNLQHKIQSLLQSFFNRAVVGFPNAFALNHLASLALGFLRAWHYVKRCKISGDYLEFGLYEGKSFDLSLRIAHKFYRNETTKPRFFGFDSFAGLPSPTKNDDQEVFQKGEACATFDIFSRYTKKAAKNFEHHIISGFYNETLTPELHQKLTLKKAAFINIDCNLYESTLDVLRFVTPLVQTGTLIYFDDWFMSGGDMTLGEAGACQTWLKENAHLELIDFGFAGTMGKFFIVKIN